MFQISSSDNFPQIFGILQTLMCLILYYSKLFHQVFQVVSIEFWKELLEGDEGVGEPEDGVAVQAGLKHVVDEDGSVEPECVVSNQDDLVIGRAFGFVDPVQKSIESKS